jgi:hypothetical protein
MPDYDCDGLADDWERAQAYDSSSDADSLTVPLSGANWQHKDLFVELDYMPNTAFSHTAVQHVIDAFAGANVWNPGGELGITLHVTEDTSTPLTDAACWHFSPTWTDFDASKPGHIGTSSVRSTNPNPYQDAKDVIVYGTVIHQQCESIGSSGNSEIQGNDFVISLGSFTGGVGNIVEQESTLMHELGHTLGLNHGGSAATPNCKPNFLSVMNWGMQFADSDVPGRRLDYSRSVIVSMPETGLTEPGSIGASSPPTQPTAIGHTNPPAGTSRTRAYNTGSTNLNYNWYTGDTDPPYESGLSSVLHNWGRAGCVDNTPTTLFGYWDWAGLKFWNGNPNFANVTLPGGNLSASAGGPPPPGQVKSAMSIAQSNNTYQLNANGPIAQEAKSPQELQLNLPPGLQLTLPQGVQIIVPHEGLQVKISPHLATFPTGLECNPLESSCKFTPCDPQDKECTFEKRTDFSGYMNSSQDYGNNKRDESHKDQTYGDILAVNLANLLAFNSQIQSLPNQAFNSSMNATDIKSDFQVKIDTGTDSLRVLLNESKVDKVVVGLKQMRDSLPTLLTEPYLTPNIELIGYLISGTSNLLPDVPKQ